MTAVEADPIGIVFSVAVAFHVGLGEGQAAVAAGRDVVVRQAVPGVTFGEADVSTAKSHAVADDDPFEAAMDSLGEHRFGMVDFN